MHRDEATVLDLLLSSQRVLEGLGDSTFEEFAKDWRLQSIVLHQLLILGEAAKRLSEDFKNNHPQLPWRKIGGLRDVLIHSYDSVDLEAVYEIVKRDVPPLVIFLRAMTAARDSPS